MTTEAAQLQPPREIRGPSAFSGGLRRFVDLTWTIGLSEYRLSYFGSALGYLWSLMRPLFLFGVLYLVFSQILRFGGGIESYPVLLLLNIVLFSFFAEATQASVTSVVARENLVRKMEFPRLVIPLSVVLTAALNLLFNLLAVFVFVLAYGIEPRASWLLFPLVLIPLVVLTSGMAMILSSLYVRFRDVAPIWSVLSTVLFYGTPVLYAIDTVPANFREIAAANPLAALLEQARSWIVDPGAPSAVEAVGGFVPFLVPLGLSIALCVAGLWLFDREAPRIAERL